MRKKTLFLILGAAALVTLAIVGVVLLNEPRERSPFKSELLEDILAHGKLVTTSQTEEHELRQYIYNDSDYEVYGQEVKELLAFLDRSFPNQLSYAANGADYDRYAPKENAKFRWGLMWVTPQNELIKLILASTDMTGEPALLVKLSVERNALVEVRAEVTEKTDDALWVKTDAQAESVQVIWDCDGVQFTNPVNQMDYIAGDTVTLWLTTESNENADGSCVLIVKAQ